MPLTRYQIRNEYSLADPELYRAADKDDPEALLEGVAMAGLVGVLRQLGDLAEFAAEIFHDLHEEVMVTAARCHGLMVRVHQLEAEFPSIEKAFLSQTSHSLFFYNPGVDWHPNLRMDQNLITRGDLPRFVMDSYEECRGPPRLFLLDKFDVAGAGACLKRYTDPSFFKAESASAGMTNSEVQREKKTRKAKKKGSRWRNGETPEVLPTSHAKLHQLFLEESVENHINDPARRLKLKRRLSGFSFDLKTRESYMEKLLNASTPDQNDVREISVNLPPSKLPSDNTGESGIEIPEISTVSPDKEVSKRKRSPHSSPDVEETGQKPSIDELREEVDYGISELPKLNAISEADNILPALHEDIDEKEILGGRERKIQDSSDGYESDDIGSEIDNYMDALTTMDSEVETDMECKAKNVRHFLNVENQGRDSDANEEQQYLQACFSDSQSMGNSAATDDGNSLSTKEICSFSYSNSLSNLAENALSDGDVSSKILAANGSCGAEIVNISSEAHFVNDESPSTQAYEHTVCSGSITSYRSDTREPSSSSRLTDSIPMTFPGDPGKNSMEVASMGPELDEISSNRNGLNTTYINLEEDMACLGDNFTCTSSHSNVQSQTRVDFLSKQSSTDHLADVLDDGDPHVLSHASLLHPSNILELASEKRISENLSDDMLRTAYAKDDCPKETVDRQIDSPHSVAAHAGEHPDSALPEPETCDPNMKPAGIVSEVDNAPPFYAETVSASTPMVDGLQAANFTRQQFLGISENIPPRELDSVEEGFLYSGKKNLDGASNAADSEDLGGFSTDMDMAGKNDANLKFPSDLQSLTDPTLTADADLDGVVTETVNSEVVVAAAIVSTHSDDNGNDGKSLSGSPKLKEESTAILQDLLQNDMEISPQVHLQEVDSVIEVDRLAVASSDLDSVVCNTVPCDDSNSELLNSVPDSSNAAISENSLHAASVTTVLLSSNQHDQDLESKSYQQIDVSLHVTDATTVLLSTDQRDQDLKSESAQQIDVIEKDDADAAAVPLSSDQHNRDSESKSAQQIDVIEKDDADAAAVPLSSDQHNQDSESKSARQIDVNENDDADATTDQHDQDSESKSSRQIDVNENDDADATTVPLSSDQHGQDSESKSARQIDVNENDDADATTVPSSSDQNDHSQDSESKSTRQIDVSENDDADATAVPLSSDQHGRDSESKSARQIDVNENDDADATTVPLSSDQNDHDQDSESKSAQLIDVIENDGVSSQAHHIAEPRTPLEQKAELQSDQFDVESWHDQDLESKSAQQPDVIVNGVLSSPSHHIPVPRTPVEQKSVLQSDEFDVESWIDQVSESVSVQQINVSDNAEGDVPSPTHHIAEPTIPLEQKAELQCDQFDVESWHADNASFNPFSLVEQIQSPNRLDQERHADALSEICAACVPSQPSVSEFFAQLDVSEQAKDPSSSTLPSFGLLPEVSQISMDEMPPLPPLPPVQWRMGKVQHPSVSLERDSAGHNLECIPKNLPIEGEITQPSNPFLPLSSLKDENFQHGQENLAGYMVHSNPLSLQVPTLVNHGDGEDDFPTSGTAPTNPFLELPTICSEKSEHGFIASEGGIAQPIVNPYSSVPGVEDTVSKYPSTSLLENLVQPLHQTAPETSWEDGKLQGTSVISEGKAMNPPGTISQTPMTQYDQPRHVFSTSEEQTDLSSSTSASLPDGKPNGNMQVKLPRPRNPLFDDVAALDKSKLRKVTERVRPQMVQKVDERDSLLEQIRTKSFNLKPAASTRPSIQGPKTNLKVAAILEKANAIRQAWAGSDEDDDADSWSDS